MQKNRKAGIAPAAPRLLLAVHLDAEALLAVLAEIGRQVGQEDDRGAQPLLLPCLDQLVPSLRIDPRPAGDARAARRVIGNPTFEAALVSMECQKCRALARCDGQIRRV